jgi:two-component system response regulator PilR (NtrC family)
MTQLNANILVVDDELSMRELLDYMLSREGYKVSLAESGRSAAQLIEKSDFDLLLCDIKLGDMTGLDVLRAAKSKSPPDARSRRSRRTCCACSCRSGCPAWGT